MIRYVITSWVVLSVGLAGGCSSDDESGEATGDTGTDTDAGAGGSAASGGSAGAGASASGGSSGAGGSSGPAVTSCDATFSDSESYSCDHADGSWSCDCNGTSATSDASDCDAALADACGLCASDPGACKEDGDAYLCACTFYGLPARTVTSSSCEQALQDGCSASGTGGDNGCNSLLGYCDATNSGFDCQCKNGSAASVAGSDVGDCATVLSDSCGEIDALGDAYCSQDDGSECTLVTRTDEPNCFDCLCIGAVAPDCLVADSCFDALTTACP